jgi:TonB family protein
VDRTWRFTGIEGRWPLDARWEGPVTMRFPDGPYMGPGPASANVPVLSLETSAGAVAFANAALRSDPPGVDVALRFSGMSGGGREGASFDEAEREALSPTFMSSFSTMSFSGPGGGFISGGSGTWTGSTVGGGGGPAGQRVEARTFGTARPSGTMPRILHRVEAEWPQAARDAGVRGVVLVQVAVAADGTVRDAQVVRSIPMLNAAAIAAVRQWRFEAAGAEGRPDPLSITVPIVIPAPQR